MNNKKSLLISIALVVGMLASYLTAFAYSDVDSTHWAKVYVDDLSAKGYVNGYEDGTFRPSEDITRAEVAAIITRMFGTAVETDRELSDVPADAWYASVMKKAVAAGFITGYEDGTFRPNGKITRQEASVIVNRAWGYATEGTLSFNDNADIADWAKDAVSTLVSKGVINGYEDGTFLPANNITRAELAKILYCANAVAVTPAATATVPPVPYIGGGSTGGGNTGGKSTPKPTAVPGTPAPTATPAPEIVIVHNPESIVTDVDISLGNAVAAEDEVAVTLNLGAQADPVKTYVSFSSNGEVVTMTVAEFNAAGIKFTPSALSNTGFKIYMSGDALVGQPSGKTVTVPVTINVSDEDGEKILSKAINVDVKVAVDRVLNSLEAYQGNNSKLYTDQLALVMVGEDNEAKLADWATANVGRENIYLDVILEIVNSNTFKGQNIAANTVKYKLALSYTKAMKDIIDNTVLEVVRLAKADTLSAITILAYYNDVISVEIDNAVNATDRDALKTLAKNMMIRFGGVSGSVDAINAAVASAPAGEEAAAVYAAYRPLNMASK